ncbi:hypothetical protein [Paenibacillus marinisediminis]
MNKPNGSSLLNEQYNIEIDPVTGGILSLVHPEDSYGMNWVEGKNIWGGITSIGTGSFQVEHAETKVFDNVSTSIYFTEKLNITVERSFNPDGMFQERYIFENKTTIPQTYGESDLGIFTVFNENYQDSATCITRRCHTHIWCGENVSYVNALRMGGEAPHLGLVLTSGSLSTYSVIREETSDDRGDFILHPSPFTLAPKQSMELSWVIFWHQGPDDFYRKALTIPGFVKASASEYTLFQGETTTITAQYAAEWSELHVSVNHKPLQYAINGKTMTSVFSPEQPGEYIVILQTDTVRTFLKILVLPFFEHIVNNRCEYIVDKQQYLDEQSPLYGAYLIYDKEAGRTYYSQRDDHNAGRERLAMGALLALYLSDNKGNSANTDLENSLDLYDQFIRRELYDEQTGIVFNNINRNNDWHRLYNYPWVAVINMELFKLKGNSVFLERMTRALKTYYHNGGHKFYCICMPMYETIQLLNEQGMTKESNELLGLYRKHANYIMENGINYPPHEVNYEQGIVAPAAIYTTEVYLLTGEKKYLEAAEKHIRLLSLFSGDQPDYHLNRIAIRHWDGYWFGKRKLYGDTFPHYWSTLTAVAYKYYYMATKQVEYKIQANTILRNNLCLFDRDGFGSSAHVYPFSINKVLGRYYDPWSNDQDWGLYYALKFLDKE